MTRLFFVNLEFFSAVPATPFRPSEISGLPKNRSGAFQRVPRLPKKSHGPPRFAADLGKFAANSMEFARVSKQPAPDLMEFASDLIKFASDSIKFAPDSIEFATNSIELSVHAIESA